MCNCLLPYIDMYGKAHYLCHAIKEMQFVKYGQFFYNKNVLDVVMKSHSVGLRHRRPYIFLLSEN